MDSNIFSLEQEILPVTTIVPLTDSHDEDLPPGECGSHLLVPAGLPGGPGQPGVLWPEDVLYEVWCEGVTVSVLCHRLPGRSHHRRRSRLY